MNSVTNLSTLSLQGIMACRITSRVALQRTYRDKCHFYRLCGQSFCCMREMKVSHFVSNNDQLLGFHFALGQWRDNFEKVHHLRTTTLIKSVIVILLFGKFNKHGGYSLRTKPNKKNNSFFKSQGDKNQLKKAMEKKNKPERNKKSVRLKTIQTKKLRLITVYHYNITRLILACENIRFSSLLAAGDVSRGGTSVTQRQKFHTDDVKSVRNPVRSADWSTEQLHCVSYCLRMTDKRPQRSIVNAKNLEQNSQYLWNILFSRRSV